MTTPTAALAEALDRVDNHAYMTQGDGLGCIACGVEGSYGHTGAYRAAAILAALDGWALVPTVATADWTGSTRKEVEIARLRAALAMFVTADLSVTQERAYANALAAAHLALAPDAKLPPSNRSLMGTME